MNFWQYCLDALPLLLEGLLFTLVIFIIIVAIVFPSQSSWFIKNNWA